MKKHIIYFVIVLLFTGWINKAYSQSEETAEENKLLVMGVPQYLLVDGLRIDLDFKMNNPKKWLVVSPIIYLQGNAKNPWYGGYYYDYEYSHDNYSSSDFESLQGFGLELIFKQMFSKKTNGTGIYLGCGPVYRFTQLERDGLYWIEGTLNGIPTTVEETGLYYTDIHKVGANCILGVQFQIFDNFYGDLFLGFGMRYSFVSSSKGTGHQYNSSWVDYGYSGVLMVSGFRIGVGL